MIDAWLAIVLIALGIGIGGLLGYDLGRIERSLRTKGQVLDLTELSRRQR